MAESGEFSQSIYNGSDAIYDYNCSYCEDQHVISEALFYCEKCVKFCCRRCEDAHKRIHRQHVLIAVDKLDRRRNDVKDIDRCPIHCDNEATMYCQSHDVVCCYLCSVVTHRRCRGTKSLADAAKGIIKNKKLTSCLQSAEAMRNQLNQLLQNKQSDKKKVQSNSTDIGTLIENIRQMFNVILDDLEKTTRRVNETACEYVESEIDKDIATCISIDQKLKDVVEDINTNIKGKNEPVTFRRLKVCEAKAEEAQSFLNAVSTKDSDKGPDDLITFTPNHELERVLYSLESLGDINYAYEKLDEQENTLTQHGNPATPQVDDDHVYTVDTVKQYNLASTASENACHVGGLCVLPGGQIVITDTANDKIKMLDNYFKVINSTVLPTCPLDVCHIDQGEVAVAICKRGLRREIQFIQMVKEKLKCVRKKKLDHDFQCINYRDGLLYVGDDFGLYIYTVDGVLFKKPYSGYVARVMPSLNGRYIYITNLGYHKLVTLNNNYQLVTELKLDELQKTTGVTAMKNGKVLVCSWATDSILQLDRTGLEVVSTLATERQGLNGPWCMCYNEKTCELIVANSSDDILVMKLN